MPQICPPDPKSALETFNQPSKHKTSPPNLKSALQALILPSIPQICLQWPKLAPQDGRTSRNPPCVLQDIGPLGPLPCSHSTSLLDHSQQGIGYRWPCAILGWLVLFFFFSFLQFNSSHDAQIKILRTKSPPRGSSLTFKAQIPVSKPKSQLWGSNPDFKPPNPSS